jgi:REP element-mobilizing transposase RayT
MHLFQGRNMTQARNRLVSVIDTPYYHCIGRCVRRAFLCGSDDFSGKNYEHRRQWVVDRLQQLTQLFAIDVCSYAVMSNHYHVVVKLSPSSANDWPESEIVERWVKLFSGNEHTRAYFSGEMSSVSADYISTKIPIWKERLTSLSWFMRCLNEHIARKANQEDECTGHFWEGRFKSQALLDEAALMSCMAYVDLNPIRAKMAKTPEQSDYTSIQARIRLLVQPKQTTKDKPNWLLPMIGQRNQRSGIPLDLDNYLALVDWTGRAQLQNKRGAIPNHLAPILQRLSLDEGTWLKSQQHFGKQYYLVIGSTRRIKALATKVGMSWLAGQGRDSPYEAG